MLVNSPMRETRVKYRRPGASDWEYLSLEQATDMIAERVIATREQTWEEETDDGKPLKRTLGMHFLGGATLDSEENYLIKKFFTAMGAVSIENQARI
jgi:formate dehydrogenase major subunit